MGEVRLLGRVAAAAERLTRGLRESLSRAFEA